ncbi:MAG TPA: competence/damage-inducible protein A [Desulfitobacteriaceae bacterium]|jgi:nicotinamide-nucleotide amidase|nr:competence/damage-inducible protein A [Desulfitobacteriaceae bacterium]
MKTEIISTGTELVLGQTLNTNTHYLGKQLSDFGFNVLYHTIVGDDSASLENVLRQALKRADLIVTTGGLGPTADDLTKELVAKVLDLEMTLDNYSLERIKGYFAARKREMPRSNEKQAYFPRSARILPNDYGTAPGAIVRKNAKTVVILPGPPFEMQPMFEEYVIGELQRIIGPGSKLLKTRILKVFGMTESAIEEVLGELMNNVNPAITLAAKRTEIHIRIVTCEADKQEAEKTLDAAESLIRSRLGTKVFARDEETMVGIVGEALKSRGLKIATAESCTGGLIGAALTREAGSSEFYLGGVVSYANSLKEGLLGVQAATLQAVGAVSAEVAEEMAAGILGRSGADIAISVTGLAGPDGGSDLKPVGLVYIGFASAQGVEARKFQFYGGRETIRQLSVTAALNWVRQYMLLS